MAWLWATKDLPTLVNTNQIFCFEIVYSSDEEIYKVKGYINTPDWDEEDCDWYYTFAEFDTQEKAKQFLEELFNVLN